MTRRSAISVFLLSLIAAVSCQTPVIGGSCKLGTSDVQIGGKQTQFFLKCEAASDSADGEGVWVVKSRAASPPAQQSVPVENSQPQARPPMRKMSNPNICEQDNGAREQDSCAVSATCLQAHNENPTFYLQCDQTNMRWVKKSCQDGFLFNFEQQTCVVPKRSNPINPLCPDGSSPLGQCPCSTKELTCTAQGVCCRYSKHINSTPSALACQQPCSNASPCPDGLICNPKDSCCIFNRTAHPLRVHDDPTAMSFVSPASIFLGANSIFEPIKQGTSSAFRVISLEPSAYQSINSMNFDSNMDAAVIRVTSSMLEKQQTNTVTTVTPPSTSTTTKRSTGASMPPSIRPDDSYLKTTRAIHTTTPRSPIAASTLIPTLENCRGTNANCEDDSDCPTSFICDNGCCRLHHCPYGGRLVRFSCTTNYQCEAGETCLFGGCCVMKRDEAVLSISSSNDISDRSSYPSEVAAVEDGQPIIEMKSTSEHCRIDHRSPTCSLERACPENSDCVFGVCCMNSVIQCQSGKYALTLPESCKTNEDCPIGSDCEYGSCCPKDEQTQEVLEESTEETSAYESFIETTTASTTISIASTLPPTKRRCLLAKTCSTLSLCPAQFTCMSNKKCCRLNFKCPSGSVPESQCSSDGLCPSSSHSCITIDDEKVCCPTVFRDEGHVTISKPSKRYCPIGICNVHPHIIVTEEGYVVSQNFNRFRRRVFLPCMQP
ncbi:unnamed protein product [Auanema sp. JU1783]|nr:unnamed protein product [Auanema sp. JU1783]